MRWSIALRQAQQHLKFVPGHAPATPSDISRLCEFVERASRLLVLTGAGLSTESGIPDYRSEEVGLYARSNHRPMMYSEFVKSPTGRQRYWARNYVGWPQFSSFQPNTSHYSLADMGRRGKLHWLVTQNVDALHTKAGSERVTELHGCSHRVLCLQCTGVMTRHELQHLFTSLNPHFQESTPEIAPDGDVLLSDTQVQGFKVPDCPSCGGTLMPDVVFFGDNVAGSKVEEVYRRVEESDGVLVAGSSLQVYSSYRIVKRAKALAKPLALINIGPTRADNMMDVRVSARCGEVLPLVAKSE